MKKNHILVILGLFIIAYSIFAVYQSTYAKYRKKVEQTVDISLANWDIKLNNESIAGNTTLNGNITPIFLSSEYVQEGVLAPGSVGYFDIDIDATNVDVSFSYLLFLTNNELYPDIVAYGYTIDPDNNSDIMDFTDDGVAGEIVHNTNNNKIRIHIKWDDSNNNVMDNAADTLLAIQNESLKINTSITFTQIKG